MNRMIVIVLSLVKCVMFASGPDVGLAHEKVLYEKMGWLDFQGVESLLEMGNPLDSNPIKTEGCVGLKPDAFLDEPIAMMSSKDISFICSCDIVWLYGLLVIAEANGVSGNKARFMQYGTAIAEIMETLERHMDAIGSRTTRWLRIKVESMLARLLNDRRMSTVRLSPKDIRTLLPEARGKASPYQEFHVSFRNMLVVGAALECHLRKNGHLPVSLSDENLVAPDERKDAYGEPFSYRHDGNDWMLHSGGREKAKDVGPWDVYIPYIECIGGWPTDEVWFASTFSMKRKELYTNGVVNDGHPEYRCHMRGNALYRGDRQGMSHTLDKIKKGDQE